MPARRSQGVGGGGLKGGNPREMPAIGPAFISRRCVSVPGGDLHVLSNVRHDWEDDEAKRIVANCHRAWSVTRCITAGTNQPPLDCNRSAMDDDGLVARVAAGDDTALRELFSRHAPWLA